MTRQRSHGLWQNWRKQPVLYCPSALIIVGLLFVAFWWLRFGQWDAATATAMFLVGVGSGWLFSYLRRHADDHYQLLMVSAERLDLAMAVHNDGVWDWTLSTDEVYFDNRYYEMAGYSPKDFPPRLEEWKKRIHPDDIDRVEGEIRAYLDQKKPTYDTEFRFRCKNGQWLWIRAKGKVMEFDDAGRPSRLVGIHRDVSARRAAQEELQRSESRYRYIIENQGEGMGVVDLNETFVYANPAAHRIFGVSDSQLINRSLWDFIDPAHQDFIRQQNDRRHKGDSNSYEVEIRRQDGARRLLLVTASPNFDAEGNHCGAIGIFRDITERKQIEKNLIDINRRLAETTAEAELLAAKADAANAAKRQFLANTSHEIRTPLNGILGMSSFLLDTPLTTEQQQFAQTIRTNADALLNVVNDILDFSKIEAGKFELNCTTFNLPALLHDIHASFILDAANKNLQLPEWQTDEIPEWVRGDSVRLRQVLTNLLSNAIKFTESGGVHLSAKVVEKDAHNHSIAFTVRDTGIGIAKEKRGRLFDPFSQLDDSMTRHYGGSGLGLAICRQLTELMHGSIELVQTEDADCADTTGSEFRLILPLQSISGPNDSQFDKETSWHGAFADLGLRVLITDDNRTNQRVCQVILNKLGVTADTADSGQDALKRIQDTDYNLIFMDVQMPGMDGYETCAKIHAHWNSLHKPPVPIIALTAHAMDMHRQACLEAGMNDYLAKPINLSTVGNTLQRWLANGTKPTQPEY